ncbi:MAG: sulfite exporter TauE/SafE family protein [Oscillospiraceae bacterium]|nr:sulfite exporter TauE/SafE family protein [Oscillospiraceae bacterium]
MKTETQELKIRGMICRSCVGEVEALLLHTRGVIRAKVSYLKGQAQLEYDPELVSLDDVQKRLAENGYESGDRGLSGLAMDGLCLALTLLLTWLLLGGGRHSMELGDSAGFGAAFLLGLMTSPHCLGMCGGILLGNCAQSRSPALASLAYNGGRVLAYTAIGGIFGALGIVIAYNMSVKSMVFTMVGLAVSLIGLNLWGLLPGLTSFFPLQPSFCQLPTQTQKRFAGRPLLIGLLTGLMPCGSLYAMWLHAVSGGSAAYGAESMLAFALGTAPLLFLFGALGALIPKKWNKYFLKASAVLVTSMGMKMLITGLRML